MMTNSELTDVTRIRAYETTEERMHTRVTQERERDGETSEAVTV